MLVGWWLLATAGCGGLDPADLPPESFVNGVVRYVGGAPAWPDTMLEVRVVLFDSQPPVADSVLGAIVNGNAAFSDTLARFSDSTAYSLNVDGTPRTFRYVVVAGRVGPNLLQDWKMLALYADEANPGTPKPLEVGVGQTVRVDFVVDFANLPPQPF